MSVEIIIDDAADAALIRFAPVEEPGSRLHACNPECPELGGDMTLHIDQEGRLISIELRGIRRILPRGWQRRFNLCGHPHRIQDTYRRLSASEVTDDPRLRLHRRGPPM